MRWNIQPNFLKAKAMCRLRAAKMLPERSIATSYKTCTTTRVFVHPTFKQSQGFTLLELLAVITLLGLLAVVAVTSLDGIEEESKVRITKVEMSELRKALRQFKRDVRHFPDEVEGNANDEDRVTLLVKCSNDSTLQLGEIDKNGDLIADDYDLGCSTWSTDTARGWHGPYVLSEGIADSWGTPYRLSYENLEPRLISHGENKQYEGVNTADRCIKNGTISDDIVLCLLK